MSAKSNQNGARSLQIIPQRLGDRLRGNMCFMYENMAPTNTKICAKYRITNINAGARFLGDYMICPLVK